MIEEEQAFRPLYYLFDIHDRNAILTSNVMRIDTQTDWGSDYQVHTGVSPRTCALLMLNLISHDCGVDSNRSLEGALRLLNEHEVILFYKQVIDIFTKSAETNDVKVAKESSKEGSSKIEKQIIEHIKNRKQDKTVEEDGLVHLHEIPKDYSISLHHCGIACDLTREQFPAKRQMASADVTCPENNVLKKMRHILTQLSKLATKIDPITLRFVIAGGNAVLNATITALMNKFNLEFMVIPYSLNNFSDWLARQDPWYFRHVYLPLQSKLYIAPSLQPDTKPKLSANGKLHTVGEFYRDMAESYAHEADEFVPLMLWECHCWSEKPFTQTPKTLIPFCQRVVLGREAEFVGQQIMFTQGDDESEDEAEYKEEEKTNIHESNMSSGNVYSNNSNNNNDNNGDNDDNNDNDKNGNTNDSLIDSGNDTNNDPTVTSNHYDSQDNVTRTRYESHSNYNDEMKNHINNYDLDNNDDVDMEVETFVFQPFPLDVEWQSVDMIGKPNNFILQKQQYLTSLTISSCPRFGDKGFPASPCNEGVAQMYADLSDASRKRKFQEYGLFKNEPSQHIKSATITTSDVCVLHWICYLQYLCMYVYVCVFVFFFFVG